MRGRSKCELSHFRWYKNSGTSLWRMVLGSSVRGLVLFCGSQGVSVRVSVEAEFQGILCRFVSLRQGSKLIELHVTNRNQKT